MVIKNQNQDQLQNDENVPEFAIQRIYTKDLSFEAPNTPFVFQEEWQPDLNLDIQTSATLIADDLHEVVLTITATVMSGKKTAFVVEVKQAGIFTLKNFPEDQQQPILGSVCPGIIYPYAREVISDVVTRGGFPQLCLAPVNFDALYTQFLQEQESKEGSGQAEAEEKENGKVH